MKSSSGLAGAVRALLASVTLFAIAAMPVPSAADDAAGAQPGRRAHFSLTNAGETYTRRGEVREIKLTAIDSGGRFSIVEGELSRGGGAPAHYHKWHSETFYVTSGQVEWTVDGETHLMGPGSLVYIPPGLVHSVKVIGDQPEHHLLIVEPAGHEYTIRRQQSQPQGAPPPSPAAMAEMNELNDFYMAPAKK